MIIASALKRLLEGLEVDLNIDGQNVTTELNFHYGDNKELAAWIVNNKNSKRYPLVWYVVEPYYDQENGFKEVSSKLIIFQNTKPEWLNTTRSIETYDAIIEPVWIKVKEVLERNPFISILGDRPKRWRIKDEPNYGVNDSSDTDFTNTQKRGEKSVSLDIVDGRIIEINFRIKTNCI